MLQKYNLCSKAMSIRLMLLDYDSAAAWSDDLRGGVSNMDRYIATACIRHGQQVECKHGCTWMQARVYLDVRTGWSNNGPKVVIIRVH